MSKQLIIFIIDAITGKHITSVSFIASPIQTALQPALEIIRKAWDEFLFIKKTVKSFQIGFDTFLAEGYPNYFRRVPQAETEFGAYCTALVDIPASA